MIKEKLILINLCVEFCVEISRAWIDSSNDISHMYVGTGLELDNYY